MEYITIYHNKTVAICAVSYIHIYRILYYISFEIDCFFKVCNTYTVYEYLTFQLSMPDTPLSKRNMKVPISDQMDQRVKMYLACIVRNARADICVVTYPSVSN